MKCQCGKEATFFHSKCCNAHFEGVILPDGKYVIACEKCGLLSGELKKEERRIRYE